MTTERQKVIRRRRHRKEKLGKLKKQYITEKNRTEKDRLLELILKRDPLFLIRLEKDEQSGMKKKA
jgi:hypothetical protein